MRLFIASFLAPRNIETFEELVGRARTELPGALRPVPLGSHHLTMAFLGDVGQADLPECRGSIAFAANVEPLPYTLGPPRVLYARKRTPRLVCADLVDGVERYDLVEARLHREVSDRFPELRLSRKRPHVTLARFNKATDRDAARGVVAWLSGQSGGMPIVADQVARIHLVRSNLGPEGPVYERLCEVRLRGSVAGGNVVTDSPLSD